MWDSVMTVLSLSSRIWLGHPKYVTPSNRLHFTFLHNSLFQNMFKIYSMFEIFSPGQFQMKLFLSIFQIHGGPGWDPVSLCWSTYFIQTLHIVSMAKHLWDLSANYSRVLSMSLRIQEYTSKTYFTNNIAEIYWP